MVLPKSYGIVAGWPLAPGQVAGGTPTPTLLANALIIDTDFASDVDDAMALGIALAHEAAGTVTLTHVNVHIDADPNAAGAEAMLRNYGSTATVSAYQGTIGDGGQGLYAPAVRERFGTGGISAKVRADYQDDVAGLRTALMRCEDGTATYASIGGFTSLARLLDSPADEISPLTGEALFRQKVALLSIMGGRFNASTAEYNVNYDRDAAIRVSDLTGVPSIWLPFEIGEPIRSGPPFLTDPTIDSIAYAYEVFAAASANNAPGYRRQSFDPCATDIACRGGVTDRYVTTAGGKVTVDPATGITTFTAGAGDSSHVVVNALGAGKSNTILANELNALVGTITKPIPANVTGFFLPLQGADQIHRDPDYPGMAMFHGGGTVASTSSPDRVVAPNGTGQIIRFNGTTGNNGDRLECFHSERFSAPSWVSLVVCQLAAGALTGDKDMMGRSNDGAFYWRNFLRGGVPGGVSWTGSNSPERLVQSGNGAAATDAYAMYVVWHDGSSIRYRINGVEVGGPVAAAGGYTGPNGVGIVIGALRIGSGIVNNTPMDLALAAFEAGVTLADVQALEARARTTVATNQGITIP